MSRSETWERDRTNWIVIQQVTLQEKRSFPELLLERRKGLVGVVRSQKDFSSSKERLNKKELLENCTKGLSIRSDKFLFIFSSYKHYLQIRCLCDWGGGRGTVLGLFDCWWVRDLFDRNNGPMEDLSPSEPLIEYIFTLFTNRIPLIV